MNLLPAITTHYSLLKGFIKPEEAAKKCKELGYTHCLLADIDTISGVVDFFNCMKKAGIVPIIGMKTDGGYFIAKTLAGYKLLIRLVSKENITYNDSDLQFYNENELNLLPVYYSEQKDAILHRIVLCSGFKTTLKKANSIDMGDYKKFFEVDEYYFKPDSGSVNPNNEKLLSELEDYTILSQPKLPRVECGDQTEAEYLTNLCRNGWRKKLSKLKGDDKDKYVERIKYELGIITGFGLSGYFLIVQDIINYVRKNQWLPGPGRGCFLPNTLVKMADGTMRPISKIVTGDIIVDAYGQNQTVYDTLEYNINEEIMELEFENGKIIKCTIDHKFLTKNRGWVEAQNLTEFDDVAEV